MEILLRCTREHAKEGEPIGHPHEFISEGQPIVCPECGNNQVGYTIVPLVRIHLLVKDDKGPIVGSKGRYLVACDPSKKALEDPSIEAWSESHLATTCPGCKSTKAYKKLQAAHDLKLFHQTGGFHVPSNFLEDDTK